MNDLPVSVAVDALHCLSADTDRETWVRRLMAAKSAGVAESTVRAWSEQAGNFDAAAFSSTWRSIKPNGGIGPGTLVHEAQQHGFTLPQGLNGARGHDADAAPANSQVHITQDSKANGGVRALRLWNAGEDAARHAYVLKKRLSVTGGAHLRVVDVGRDTWRLAVPLFSIGNGALVSLQLIDANGGKKNLAGAPLGDCAHRLTYGEVRPDATLYICEGYASADAVAQAVAGRGQVFCAVGVSRFVRVGRALRERYPEARIVFAPDRGVEGVAQKAARACNGEMATLPQYAPQGFDTWDFAHAHGANALYEAVLSVARAPAPDESRPDEAAAAARALPTRKFARATMHQLLDVLAEDRALCGLVRLNEMKGRFVVSAPRPWGDAPSPYWTDADTTNLRAYVERRYGLTASKEHASDAIHTHALRNRFHPLRDWLESLAWDGVKRLDRWLIRYCGAVDTPYVREVARRFLISAVARIMRPGCKADCMLLLEGRQGVGKSLTVRTLAGDDYYSDAVPNMDDSRHVGETVAGVWLLEFSEIVGLRRHEADAVKAFLSRSEDAFRPAYGRESVVVPRQFVTVGTVNRDGEGTYLRDETGGRRFWPVTATACDIDALTTDRSQLWAEAVAGFRAGESWWIEDDAMRATAAEEVKARTVKNPWLDHVVGYLTNNPGIAEVKTGDVFWAVTKRAHTCRDTTDLRHIANALRESGFEQHSTNRCSVWRLPRNGPGGP